MMTRLRISAVWAGIALVLLTNALVLGHVLLNRNGGPDSTLRMSERELALPFNWRMTRENSGLSLRIDYHVPISRKSPVATEAYFPYASEFAFDNGDASWLDDAHLVALGFDVKRLRAATTEKRGGAPTSKEVLLVLELDGPAYAAAVERVQHKRDEEAATAAANPGKDEFVQRAMRAAEAASFAEHRASRLFVVDAGLDRDELRGKYPNRERYAIVRGILRPLIAFNSNTPAARLERLSIGEITVPYALRRPFERMAPSTWAPPQQQRRDRFEATVSWGQLFEPWVDSATVH